MIEPRKAAELVMEKLEQANYQAYMVGGCVRDLLLGRSPNDFDLATDAEPSVVQELFPHTVPTGIKHGTVTVLIEQVPIEVTTFRIEGEYKDGRRPEEVQFVKDLSQDLARRDFTINAMALDRRGNLIDYFQGKRDLEQGIIRAVGEAKERFHEDALRMVRAIRFAAQFEFQLEENTLQAIQDCSQKAKNLAVERVQAELEKLWKARKPSIGIKALWDTGLLEGVPPFTYWKKKDRPTDEEIAYIDLYDDPILRWTYFLYLLGVSEDLMAIRLKDLKLSNRNSVQIIACITLSKNWTKPKTKNELTAFLLQHGLERVIRANQFASILIKDQNLIQTDDICFCWEKMPVKMLKDLEIKGSDLIRKLGRPGGSWVKKTLSYLLEKVAFQELSNDRTILLQEGERYAIQCTE